MSDPEIKQTSNSQFGHKTSQIGFLLVPGFALLNFSAAIDPLYSANRLSSKQLYEWSIITRDGSVLDAGNGVSITPDYSFEDTHINFDLIIVCAGFVNKEEFQSRQNIEWLRRHARKGAAMGAISTGSEILANAGLLDGYRCTIHWENDQSFRENHPDAILTGGIYELDRNRITAAGGIASLDMILNWISQTNGEFLASAIAEQFVYNYVRLPSQSQRSAEHQLIQRRSPRLAKAMQLMLANTEEPLSPDQLASEVGLSRRQLERLFIKYRQMSLHQYYLETRLQNARHLILNTGMPLVQVAIASGFSSQSHFSRAYKKMFSNTPSQDRLLIGS